MKPADRPDDVAVGRGPVTDLEAGSTFVVSWYLGYAHNVSL